MERADRYGRPLSVVLLDVEQVVLPTGLFDVDPAGWNLIAWLAETYPDLAILLTRVGYRALRVLLGLPEHKVRVVQAETGGGFGGKEDFPSMLAGHAALAPVYRAYTVRLRAEVLSRPVPEHVALIMDGNRRWARQLGVRMACERPRVDS